MERIKAISIQEPRPDSQFPELAQRANGVLAVYFFHHEFGTDSGRASDAFSDHVLTRLADYASAIRCRQDKTRRLVALAKIESLIRQSPPIVATFMEELKNILSKVFVADGCTLFVAESPGSSPADVVELHPVATTGLVVNDQLVIHTNDAIDRLEPPTPDELKPGTKWSGLTRFLAFHPGTTVRKNDLYQDEEILGGIGDTCTLVPRVAMPEALVPPEIGNHRFLGASCGTLSKQTEPTAANEVIRLVRTSDSPPFTKEDEDLLREIAVRLTPIFEAVREQQDQIVDEYSECQDDIDVICRRGPKPALGNAVKRAACRINTNSSRWMLWNRADLESLLQDLLLMFEPSGGCRASVSPNYS